MKFLEIPFLKGFSFLAFSSFPVGLFFFNSSFNEIGKEGGLVARVNLFWDGNNQAGISPAAAASSLSVGGGSNQIDMRRRIVQVSEETKDNSQNNKPILRAEFYLKSMEREDYWKFCISEKGKEIFKKQESSPEVTTSTTSSSSAEPSTTNNEECKWKTLSQSRWEDKENHDLISHVLRLMYRFWRVEHVYNMLALYKKESQISSNSNGGGGSGSSSGTQDIKITWESNQVQATSTNQNTNNDLLKKIKESCDLKPDQDKEALSDLFLSPDLRKKSCLPSPVVTNIHLKLDNQVGVGAPAAVAAASSQDQSQITNTLTKESISSKGTFSGKLGYSLFDYWTYLKKPKNGEQSQRLPIILFETENKYSLKEDGTEQSSVESGSTGTSQPLNLKKLFDSLGERTLNLENFSKEKKNITLKLQETSSSSENLIY
ncbi:hypothetical protein [Mycoplasma suis]|uniref:Uncharacterized protein n=2 Tax=Mycoplasma suis TaxID=57372 RepID=F0QRE4_MYCSL|nr:hypothetical protein [Mycoplasma suis]ADX98064.1 hypothetical protein MSU_0530 [Mycoplasma suis str. Illinois]CBZ40562.1 hypothetical protein MSUIS_04690 [Mycoplasma suis KI3806]